jgi:methenyltetrahydrofolate cyclohydrolase
MEALGEQTVDELIEALAAPSPAPGGGSSAALARALAAGLAELTAAIAGDSADEAGGRADRDRRVGEALAAASEPPLEIARAAAEVGAVALGVAAHASASVRGDVITSVLLAEAAARSAAAARERVLG